MGTPMEWTHHANCNPNVACCYVSAGKRLGVRLRIGPPSSRGLSWMRGVYTEPLSHERNFDLTHAYFDELSKYNNDPFKARTAIERGPITTVINIMPQWLKAAWIVCGICWVLLIMMRFGVR